MSLFPSYRNGLQRIATDSGHLLRALDSISRTTLKSRISKSSSSLSTPCAFPLPRPLTPELMAMGLNESIAHLLSLAFIQAFHLLKQKFEAELQHADEACIEIISTRNTLMPEFQDRMRSIYVLKFLDAVKVCTSEGMVAIQSRLLDVNLKSKPSLNISWQAVFETASIDTSGATAAGPPVEIEDDDVSKPSIKLAEEKSCETNFNLPTAGDEKPDCLCHGRTLVELPHLFRSRSHSDHAEFEDLFSRDVSTSAFPKQYPCPAPTSSNRCLTILSRGFKRVMRHTPAPTIDSLVETMGCFTVAERVSMTNVLNKVQDDTVHDQLMPSSHTPSSPQFPFTASSYMDVRQGHVNALPTPPHHPQIIIFCLSPSRTTQPITYNRRAAVMPKRGQAVLSACVPSQTAKNSREISTSNNLSPPISAPGNPVDKPNGSPLSIDTPSTPLPFPARRRKVMTLPTRRPLSSHPSASVVSSSTTAPSASFAPLSVANVSALCQPISPSTRSRSIIPRTPSLVSLASSDSTPSSPDELNTPPSTPPAFVTRFPPPISASSPISMSKYEPGASSSGVFQSPPTPLPKKLEITSPSEPAPLFSFSTGIKREDRSFSFTFSRW
uniref:B2 mating type protein n=1 Tax=Heterobasidion abietinum TaxID=207833 RepID=S5R7J2_9AGAM|nr:b2 mating type protein [Heterobasidion abietinum]